MGERKVRAGGQDKTEPRREEKKRYRDRQAGRQTNRQAEELMDVQGKRWREMISVTFAESFLHVSNHIQNGRTVLK